MANALEAASLVMIPSGYEDGTLGSLKPTDGSGDFTFSRGSNLSATRINEQGYIEKGYENLLLQSNTFSDATWTKTTTSVTSGQSGYDGSSDAWLLTATTTLNAYMQKTGSFSGVNTFSIYAKANTSSFFVLFDSANPYVYFNLGNGTIGTKVSNPIDAKITSAGNGWYRCSITTNNPNNLRIYVVDADGSTAVTNGNSIYIQDAMLNQGLVAYPYIETTTAPVAGGILEDMPRLDWSGSCPSLLLEPSRTNLIPYSEYFDGLSKVGPPTLTLEDINSPEGVGNSYSIVKRSATDNSDRVQYSLGGLGTNHTLSIFLKLKSTTDTFNVRLANNQGERVEAVVSTDGTMVAGGSTNATNYDIEDYGNGWYRLWMETTTNATSNFYQLYPNITNTSVGECYFYGAQAEEGSYTTSYIPTYGVSQTRLAEKPSISQFQNVFDSSGNYTLFFEIERLAEETDLQIIYISGPNGYFRLDAQSNGRITYVIYDGISAVTTATTANNQFAVGTASKILYKQEGSVGKCFVNGQQLTNTDPSILANNLSIWNENRNHKKHKEVYFPTALSDSECIALTTI